jgi:hypothetical protein
MSWAQRAAANLLPLSVEQSDLAVALREWVYERNVVMLESPSEVCQLCDHPGIRYQFEIVNHDTGHSLYIGSECIKRFAIGVRSEGGTIITGKAADRSVDADRRRMEQEARDRSVLNSLVELAATDDKFDLEDFIVYYQRRGAFTPSQMALLVWRFQRYGVEHRPAHFKVSLRRQREQEQLRRMPDWRAKLLWLYLSAQQRQWYEDDT